MVHLRRWVVILSSLPALAGAQAMPASPPSSDMPMADYLALLEKIAPAARQGAQAYLLAAQSRCGMTPSTAQLRHAFSAGNGDPALMGMIRASQVRDPKALAEWAHRIDCGSLR